MPIYEYECVKCGIVEVMQNIKDKPLKRCPKCGAKARKLVSQTSFHLKGSGWYVTDYAGKGKSPDSKKKSEPAESATTTASCSCNSCTPQSGNSK